MYLRHICSLIISCELQFKLVIAENAICGV